MLTLPDWQERNIPLIAADGNFCHIYTMGMPLAIMLLERSIPSIRYV
jgi:hypothetical protein